MKAYEWKAIFGGRGRLAGILDAILLFLIVWVAAYLLLQRSRNPVLISFFATSFLMLLAALPMKQRLSRVRRRIREGIRKELIEKQILLLPTDTLVAAMETSSVIQCANARLDDVLPLLRKGVEEIWFCGKMDAEIERFVKQNAGHVKLHPSKETTERFLHLVSDLDVEAEIERRSQRKKLIARMKEQIKRWKPNRFTVLGGLLMALSFTTRYQMYFRLLATASFFIGSLLYTKQIMENVVRAKQNGQIGG